MAVETPSRWRTLAATDPEIAGAIGNELHRQNAGLELIASENFVSQAVLQAAGSVMTNKYAEGYPGRRYYGGCENVDTVENLAGDRAKALFACAGVNVQPHSGTQANIAALMALAGPRDKILSMSLDHGGHLSHGHPKNFTGLFYEVHAYGVEKGSSAKTMNGSTTMSSSGWRTNTSRR